MPWFGEVPPLLTSPHRPCGALQAQGLQTVLLLCLATLALCSTPFADTLEAAFASPTGAPQTPAATLADRLQVAFGVVVPGLAILWAYVGKWVVARLRPCRDRLRG
jgi:hypothetical protein